jgi:hypothetical protein
MMRYNCIGPYHICTGLGIFCSSFGLFSKKKDILCNSNPNIHCSSNFESDSDDAELICTIFFSHIV